MYRFSRKNRNGKAIRAWKRYVSMALAVALILTASIWIMPERAKAASGTVYSCTVNRTYQHPVTGVIEDSGGEESYSIGQGMVEGAVYPNGILEVTDDGKYYLTIRMSLMDYTAGHTFWVQTWGEDGWSSPAAGITGTGSDSNGSTADICIQVPSEQCVVRGAMYVDPMGRDVYWYMYPSNFSKGNNTDMNATMVTEASGSNQQSESQSGSTSSSGSSSGGNSNLTGGGSLSSSGQSLGGSSSSGSSDVKPSSLQSTANPNTDAAEGENADSDTENTLSGLNSSIGEPEANAPDTESVTDGAQGLSLSTAGETAAAGEEADDAAGGAVKAGGQVMQNSLSVLIPGVILIAIAALVVYFFRRNWHKWGHAPNDDE